MTVPALVGTIGAVSTGASGASVTPSFGAGESRTAPNLLLCWVAITGSATLPSTPGGWTIAAQVAGTSCSATMYWKIATGGDSAPTISGITSAVINARVGEFSGCQMWSPVDQSSTQTTPITGTTTASNATADVIPQEIAAGVGAVFYSDSTTKTIGGSIAVGGGVAGGDNVQNGSTSTSSHYNMNWVGILSNAVPDSDTVTYTNTNVTGVAVAFASFRIFSLPMLRPAPQVKQPLVASYTRFDLTATATPAPLMLIPTPNVKQRPLPPIRTGKGKRGVPTGIAPSMPPLAPPTKQRTLEIAEVEIRAGAAVAPAPKMPPIRPYTKQRPLPPIVAGKGKRGVPIGIAPPLVVVYPDVKQRPLPPIRVGKAKTPIYLPPVLSQPPRAPTVKQRPLPPIRAGRGKVIPLVPVAPLGSVTYGPKIRARPTVPVRSTVRYVPQTKPAPPGFPPWNGPKIRPQPQDYAYIEIGVTASTTPPVPGIPVYRRIYQPPLPPLPRRAPRQVLTAPPPPIPGPLGPTVKQRPLPPILRRNQRQVLIPTPFTPFPITPDVKQRPLPPILRRNQRQLLTTVAAPLLSIPKPRTQQRPLPTIQVHRGRRAVIGVAPKTPIPTPPVKQRPLPRIARGIVARLPGFTPVAPGLPPTQPKIRPQPQDILYSEIQVAAGTAPVPPTVAPPYGKVTIQRPLPPVRTGRTRVPPVLPAPAPLYPPTQPKIRPQPLDYAFIEMVMGVALAPPAPSGTFGIPYRPVTIYQVPPQPPVQYEIRAYPGPVLPFVQGLARPRQVKLPGFLRTRPWNPSKVPPAPLGSVPITPQTKQRPLPSIRRIFNRPPPPTTPYVSVPRPAVRQRTRPVVARGLPKVPPVLIPLPYYPQRPRVQQRVTKPVVARQKLPPIPAAPTVYLVYRTPVPVQAPLPLPPITEIRGYPTKIAPPIILTPRVKQRPLPPIRPRRNAPPIFLLPAPLGSVRPSKPRLAVLSPPAKSRVVQFPILPPPPPTFPIPTPQVKQRQLRLPRIFQRQVFVQPPVVAPVPVPKQRPRPPTVRGRAQVTPNVAPPPVYPPFQLAPRQIVKPYLYGVGLDRRLAPFTRMIPPVLPAPLGAVPYIPQVKQRPLPPVRKGRYRPIPGVPAPPLPPITPPPSIVRRLLRLIPFFPRPKLPPVIGPTPIVPTIVINTQPRFLPGGTAANANPGRGPLSVDGQARTLILEVNEP